MSALVYGVILGVLEGSSFGGLVICFKQEIWVSCCCCCYSSLLLLIVPPYFHRISITSQSPEYIIKRALQKARSRSSDADHEGNIKRTSRDSLITPQTAYKNKNILYIRIFQDKHVENAILRYCGITRKHSLSKGKLWTAFLNIKNYYKISKSESSLNHECDCHTTWFLWNRNSLYGIFTIANI